MHVSRRACRHTASLTHAYARVAQPLHHQNSTQIFSLIRLLQSCQDHYSIVEGRHTEHANTFIFKWSTQTIVSVHMCAIHAPGLSDL